ncbi:MAG: molybdopterin-guanine dinucleotide biosynthesis protein B [Magnetococcales bacterium]|nr:molybdopterin-guanine dinucleotide biosynthesis protein B [Magnetococcales bacterium]
MNRPFSIPLLGFAAASGSGKTTLMVAVIHHLHQQGLRVAAIKHGHHPADPDLPGKDTYRFRQAGAATVLFSSQQRWFMIQDLHDHAEPTLEEQVRHLHGHDLILVEGYKNEHHPKIVVHRLASQQPSLHEALTQVVAIATDDPQCLPPLPRFALEDSLGIARFVRDYFGL